MKFFSFPPQFPHLDINYRWWISALLLYIQILCCEMFWQSAGSNAGKTLPDEKMESAAAIIYFENLQIQSKQQEIGLERELAEIYCIIHNATNEKAIS